MMNALSSNGMLTSFAFWWHLHALFILLTLVGTLTFVVWALRSLSKDSLKTLSLWLLGLGVVGVLLTAPMAAMGFRWFSRQWRMDVGMGGTMMGQQDGSAMMDKVQQRRMMREERREQ